MQTEFRFSEESHHIGNWIWRRGGQRKERKILHYFGREIIPVDSHELLIAMIIMDGNTTLILASRLTTSSHFLWIAKIVGRQQVSDPKADDHKSWIADLGISLSQDHTDLGSFVYLINIMHFSLGWNPPFPLKSLLPNSSKSLLGVFHSWMRGGCRKIVLFTWDK